MENNIYVPQEGYIYRNKNNFDDFSNWLRIGTGNTIDNYDEVPYAVYEEYLNKKQQELFVEAQFLIEEEINNV